MPEDPGQNANRFDRGLTTPRATSPWLLIPAGGAVLLFIFGGYELLERYVLAPRLGVASLHLAHLIRGIVASMVLAGLVAWFLLRRRLPGSEPSRSDPEAPVVDRQARGRQHARWFVQMRWFAAGLTLPLIVIAGPVTGILRPESLLPLAGGWTVLVIANALFWRWAERGGHPERQILVQAVVDLIVLTSLLNASGGIENPLYIAYLFHVIIAGVLLPPPKVFGITIIAAGLVTLLGFGEYLGFMPHYTNLLFPHHDPETAHMHADAEADDEQRPLDGHVPGGSDHVHDSDEATGAEHLRADGESGAVGDAFRDSCPSWSVTPAGHASYDPVFVAGRVLPFLCVLFLTAYLTTLAADRLHTSEQELERTAEAALLDHRRLESVVGAAGVGIVVIGPDHSTRWSSRGASEWVARDRHAPGGPCPFGGVSGACRTCLVTQTFETGTPHEAERTVTSSDGALRYIRFATSPVRDPEGRVVQVVELSEDVTTRKALEARALHAGKLSVLGRMAAGIAHEIGNPLSSLSTRLELMQRRADPAFTRDSLSVLRSQISRISRIVHGVSQFARSGRQDWTLLEVNDAVREALELLRVDRRAKRIEFRERLATPSPRVRGVRDQIVQVCLNLLLNAVEALPDGGVVEVETARRIAEVTITVADDGVGIDAASRARLFEPFFTTKTDGTGLGLSISYSMVNAHSGRIEVTSEVGKGSRFEVVLPAADAAPATDAGPTARA